ncbi:hypothetical protein TNCV_2310051 [Trichonephila clavipes]|nr:hypothetical protein TNCV_2310051 [Trichonephila clavipes]
MQSHKGVFHTQNSRVCDNDNLDGTKSHVAQQWFAVNVWSWNHWVCLLGSYLLQPRLDDRKYLILLNTLLPTFLGTVLAHICQDMGFQHVGVPAHSPIVVRNYLVTIVSREAKSDGKREGQGYLGNFSCVIWNKLWPDLEGEKDFNDDHRNNISDFLHSIPGFQEFDEDMETWVACEAEDCGFQILNDDEVVTSVQEEYDPVDDETDEDEDNTTKVARIHKTLTRFLR